MVVAGIDVSKDTLHVYVRAEESSAASAGEVGEEREFRNDRQGFRGVRKWLRKRGVQRVVLESTGRFHRRVHQSLFDEGLEVLVVNPVRSRRFAEAKGDLAKTDRVDAAMLAAYGRAFPELASTEPKGTFLERLESMLVTRECLVDSRTSLTQVGEEVHRLDKKKLARICKRMSKEINALNAEIKAHLLADPDMAQRYRILLSVPGIGAVNAAMLCCYMPELGYIGNRQAASLIGVAPFNRDSGKAQGARHIRGGPAPPAGRSVHGRAGCIPLEPGHGGALQAADHRWQETQGRTRGGHAKADHSCQRAAARRP